MTQGTRNSSSLSRHALSHVLSAIPSSNRYVIPLTRAHNEDLPRTASVKNYLLRKSIFQADFFVFVRGVKRNISTTQKSWRQRSASTFTTLIYSFKSLLQKRSGRHTRGREGGREEEGRHTTTASPHSYLHTNKVQTLYGLTLNE